MFFRKFQNFSELIQNDSKFKTTDPNISTILYRKKYHQYFESLYKILTRKKLLF
jgi:hypothetical protein